MGVTRYHSISIDRKEDYPNCLRNLKNPPEKIYAVGNKKLLENKKVAIVGSRKCSPYGQWAATALAEKLSEKNITVVSGMAAGIDTFAHIGALREKGSTIAVLGCGIDRCYPAASWRIKDKICKDGLVISEYPEDTKAQRWTFPQRNRIIAALADIVVVIEAGINSGSIITAEIALDLGKEVMVLPGNINNVFSMGSNKLIRDGATPIITLDDVGEHLGIKCEDVSEKDLSHLSEEEIGIFKIISEIGQCNSTYISKVTCMEIKDVNAVLTVLEINGLIENILGMAVVKR